MVDDIMQYTESDQPIYQECLAHLSLNSHPSAQKVVSSLLLSRALDRQVC